MKGPGGWRPEHLAALMMQKTIAAWMQIVSGGNVRQAITDGGPQIEEVRTKWIGGLVKLTQVRT